LVSGLSAFAERSSKEIALVYTGPDDSDMLVAAIVLGLLAPAIAFSIASGAGIGALNTLSYAGQGFGLNTGLSMVPGAPNAGGGTVPPNVLANTNKTQDSRRGDSARTD
jgi:hypothetical protein